MFQVALQLSRRSQLHNFSASSCLRHFSDRNVADQRCRTDALSTVSCQNAQCDNVHAHGTVFSFQPASNGANEFAVAKGCKSNHGQVVAVRVLICSTCSMEKKLSGCCAQWCAKEVQATASASLPVQKSWTLADKRGQL